MMIIIHPCYPIGKGKIWRRAKESNPDAYAPPGFQDRCPDHPRPRPPRISEEVGLEPTGPAFASYGLAVRCLTIRHTLPNLGPLGLEPRECTVLETAAFTIWPGALENYTRRDLNPHAETPEPKAGASTIPPRAHVLVGRDGIEPPQPIDVCFTGTWARQCPADPKTKNPRLLAEGS